MVMRKRALYDTEKAEGKGGKDGKGVEEGKGWKEGKEGKEGTDIITGVKKRTDTELSSSRSITGMVNGVGKVGKADLIAASSGSGSSSGSSSGNDSDKEKHNKR